MTQTLASGSTIVAPAEAYRLTTPPGTRVELKDIALKSLDASVAGLTRSAVGTMRGRSVTVFQSAIGGAITRRVEARWSSLGIAIGARIDATNVITQWLTGAVVNANNVFAIAVIAPRVNGQITCLVDTKGALALGLGFGFASAVLRLIRRRF
ncbi:MAG: hypothetical protein NTX54_06610 [Chloroflexi bacterium]|nr:hypothetical protein [Chloroflexota bacterium]